MLIIVTLTTPLTTNMSVCDNLNLNVVDPGLQRSKTVECQLEKMYCKIAATEANIELFATLLSLGLATNDVKNFVQKQTIHKRVSSKPDLKVQRLAMRSKLSDACAHAKRLRQERDALRKRVMRKFSSRKSLGRRILGEMVARYKLQKNKEMQDVMKKIEFIRQKEQLDKVLKSAPEGTEDYLSDVNVFKPNQTSMKVEDPLGPFICDPTVKLDENELLILAKGPKYMVRGELDASDFNLEIEAMVAKKKYDTMFNGEDDCSNTTDHSIEQPQVQLSCNQLNESGRESNRVKIDKIAKESNILWEENVGRMVYDYKSKTLNLANMSAPTYKHNKEVFLPSPESPAKETSHEFRKREMSRVFNRVTKSISKKNYDSNLSKAELKGLKSLKRRIKNGELIVCETDKSKRFSILSRQQYIESGKAHTSKDLEIEPHHIKKIQKYVNNHTWWAKEILQCGANWNHSDRMSTNLEDNGEQVCRMSLLIKDHKSWSASSDSPPPSRPVVSGNSGLNCHLSELISTILEPIAYEESGDEIDSTDDMIAKINKINEQIVIDSCSQGCAKESAKSRLKDSKSFKSQNVENEEPSVESKVEKFMKFDIRS